MLEQLVTIWNFICNSLQSLFAFLIPFTKALFSTPLIIFVIIGLVPCFIKRRRC